MRLKLALRLNITPLIGTIRRWGAVRDDTMRNAFVTIAIAASLACAQAPAASAAEVLITPAEAKLPASADATTLGLGMRGLTRGPAVEQISPDPRSKNLKSPLPLEIKFVAHNETTVVPGSVTVTYLKTPTVDLTARLKGHITANGIDLSDCQVPPGNHLIRVEIRDSQGRKGTGIIRLSVAQ
jgi:hypothetical protein